MYAKLWRTRGMDPQELLCTIRLENGQLQIDGKISPSLRESIEYLRELFPADDKFFRMIPREFSGSLVRGQVIKD